MLPNTVSQHFLYQLCVSMIGGFCTRYIPFIQWIMLDAEMWAAALRICGVFPSEEPGHRSFQDNGAGHSRNNLHGFPSVGPAGLDVSSSSQDLRESHQPISAVRADLGIIERLTESQQAGRDIWGPSLPAPSQGIEMVVDFGSD